MTVAILVPVLWRPDHVQRLVDNVAATTPEPHRLLFIAEPTDFVEVAAIEAAGAEHIKPGPRSYADKINAGYHATTEPFLFLAADDLTFHPGWLPAALAHDAGVVGTNDGGCNPRVIRGEHSVHSLVSRRYVEKHGGTVDNTGPVLHAGYRHVFCDDELVGTARARGMYAHAADSVVEHVHPYANKAPMDRVYRKGQLAIRHDRRLFDERRSLWET